MLEEAHYAECPNCHKEKLRTDKPFLNALSRVDNKTYVCADCGILQALQAYWAYIERN